jgi:hypothetical protein
MVMVWFAATEGATNTPFAEIVPPVALQLTSASASPNAALNCALWPELRVGFWGETTSIPELLLGCGDEEFGNMLCDAMPQSRLNSAATSEKMMLRSRGMSAKTADRVELLRRIVPPPIEDWGTKVTVLSAIYRLTLV